MLIGAFQAVRHASTCCWRAHSTVIGPQCTRQLLTSPSCRPAPHQFNSVPLIRLAAAGVLGKTLATRNSSMGKPRPKELADSSKRSASAAAGSVDGAGCSAVSAATATAKASVGPRRSKRAKVEQGAPQQTVTTPCMASAAAAGTLPAHNVLLHDFEPLEEGKVLKRPSATCRTPYVADVELLGDGSTVLAHTPALDCAGVVSPGRTVWLTRNAAKPGSKQTATTHTVQLGQELREDGQSVFVGAHPAQAERFVAKALSLKLLPQLGTYTQVSTQQTFGATRMDFMLSGYPDGSRLLLEVKHVTVADYPEGCVPDGIPKGVRTYTSSAQPYSRTALFPHGTGKRAIGVVSDRAIKHLHHLTELAEAGQDDQGNPVRCALLFVVNRSDCTGMRPCHEADMLFAQMVLRAAQHGVLVLAHDIAWQGNKAYWGKELPVVHGPGVTSSIDEEHLQRVLHFNATDPRPRWKSNKESKGTGTEAKHAAAPTPADCAGGEVFVAGVVTMATANGEMMAKSRRKKRS